MTTHANLNPLPSLYITHTYTRLHTHSLCFVSQKPLVESSPNFVCICNVISQSYYIITPSWHEAILAMQMKVKGQTPLCIVFQQPLVQSSPNFVCICSVISQSYYLITTNWHEAILAMQMKVKGQISWILCWRYLKNGMSNHLQIFTVSLPWWEMDRIIRSSWYAAILVMQMKVKGQIAFSFVSQKPLVRLSSNFVCILNVIRQSFHKITPTY